MGWGWARREILGRRVTSQAKGLDLSESARLEPLGSNTTARSWTVKKIRVAMGANSMLL